MKTHLLIIGLLFSQCSQSQPTLQLIDISQQQLRLMEASRNRDSLSCIRLFKDTLYTPYQQFWNGYLGQADVVAEWLYQSMSLLPNWQSKSKRIDGGMLLRHLRAVADSMEKITGYIPVGKWYVVYGPAWTDLGGLGDFAMLIDLAHDSNTSNESLLRMFPHELTHQIMTNVNTHKDSTAVSAIIVEGFAVWMNQYYWKDQYTPAQNLGYTEEEWQLCEKNIEALKKFLATNASSADHNMIDVFRNRQTKLNEKLPGAIGYYLGYKIVDAYVHKYGKDTWRDVFIKSPREIYEQSGFIK